MRAACLTLAALLFAATPAVAQDTTPPRPALPTLDSPAQMAGAQKSGVPAMWEVSDADSKVWLFGSVHILPPDIKWRSAPLDDALRASDHVYFETDIGPLGMIAIVIKSVAMGINGANTDWVSTLSSDERAKLAEAIKPLGLSLEQAATQAPWLLTLQIEDKASLPGDYDPSEGVDMILQWELPKERKAYFESASQQIDLIAGGTPAEQVERLRKVLSGGDNSAGDVTELVSAWRNGDVAQLDKIMKSELAADPDFADALLFGRNRNWVATIKKLLATNEQDLIVVGAAHLAGDGSVLDLLAKAGFTVKRIQ